MSNTSRTSKSSTASRRNPPGPRTKVRPRSGKGGRPRGSIPLAERLERANTAKESKKRQRHVKRHYKEIRQQMLALLAREEVEELARECGFYRRTPREIRAFEFVVCSALAAVLEGKRSLASVWRLLITAAGIEVERSAVTQRFGAGSAKLMETLVERVSKRVSKPDLSRDARPTCRVQGGAGSRRLGDQAVASAQEDVPGEANNQHGGSSPGARHRRRRHQASGSCRSDGRP